MLKGKLRFLIPFLAVVLMVFASAGYAHLTQPASAGPGEHGVWVRGLDQDGNIREITFFEQSTHAMVGANTPVVSSAVCGLGEYDLHAAQVTLSGTLTGTSPSVAVKWQHSYDGGTTWQDIGSFVTIDTTAVTTPANSTQRQTVSDIRNASTAVAYGDCQRATLTFTGTGSVGGNIAVKGYNE